MFFFVQTEREISIAPFAEFCAPHARLPPKSPLTYRVKLRQERIDDARAKAIEQLSGNAPETNNAKRRRAADAAAATTTTYTANAKAPPAANVTAPLKRKAEPNARELEKRAEKKQRRDASRAANKDEVKQSSVSFVKAALSSNGGATRWFD